MRDKLLTKAHQAIATKQSTLKRQADDLAKACEGISKRRRGLCDALASGRVVEAMKAAGELQETIKAASSTMPTDVTTTTTSSSISNSKNSSSSSSIGNEGCRPPLLEEEMEYQDLQQINKLLRGSNNFQPKITLCAPVMRLVASLGCEEYLQGGGGGGGDLTTTTTTTTPTITTPPLCAFDTTATTATCTTTTTYTTTTSTTTSNTSTSSLDC